MLNIQAESYLLFKCHQKERQSTINYVKRTLIGRGMYLATNTKHIVLFVIKTSKFLVVASASWKMMNLQTDTSKHTMTMHTSYKNSLILFKQSFVLSDEDAAVKAEIMAEPNVVNCNHSFASANGNGDMYCAMPRLKYSKTLQTK